MANDFSGLGSLVNLWNFEDGALGTDSEGTDTLTAVGGAVASADEAPNQAANSYSLDVQGSDDFMYILDNDLSANHPWAEADGSGDWTWFGWIIFDADTDQRSIISKYSTDASYLRSIHVIKTATDKHLAVIWGNSDGTGFNAYSFTNIALSNTGRWYHIQLKYDESEKKIYARVWDETAGAYIYSSTFEELTVANTMHRSNAILSIGCSVYTPSSFNWDTDGRHDEYGLCNAMVSDADLDAIRAGTYGAGQTHELSASISGASGTGSPDMNVLRAVLASISAGSAVPDAVILKLLKALDASIAAGTATPDTISLEILRALAADIAGASITPDDIVLNLLKALTASIVAGTATPDDVALLIIKVLSSSIQAGSATPDDITLKLLKALTASIQGASDTSAAVLAVLRAVSATISAQSQTPDDVDLFIAGILAFSAAISAASASPDTVMLAVLREISSAVAAESTTTGEADLAVLRELSSSIAAGTATPDDVALFLLRALMASIQPGTDTATVALGILREITAAIAAGSTTQSAILSVVRQVSATVSPGTLTSAITLIILGMGVITDATIESLTAKRTISSLTTEREFESLTPERTIEKI